MFKKLYLVLAIAVVGLYAVSSWLGWEIGNSGSHSRLGIPFFYSGFHGGK
jgi:hypothetical protein